MQVAQTEATLQSQVTHYRKIVDDLTATVEQLRRQPPVPTIDTQEIGRLRREVCVCVCVCACVHACLHV